MTLPVALQDREMQKFEEVNGTDVAVRVTGSNFSGSFSPTGLQVGGLITEVTINASTWTPLPATPLANRNALSIQNKSGQQIKINYSDAVSGYVGMVIEDDGERFYDIQDNIIIYAKSSTSSCTLNVEEIA